MILSDPAAERAVLAGLCRYNGEAYYDVADIINSESFTIESNGVLYACIKRMLEEDDARKIDIASILSSAKELGVSDFIQQRQELAHLTAILKFPVLLDNVRRFAGKIRKLQIARMMHDQLEETKDKYLLLKGDEPISHILGIAEESIFDFTSLLNDHDDAPQKVFEDIEEYLAELGENPVDQIGIPTGFIKYDFAIGGGLRRGTVNVIGARPKCQPLDAKILTPEGWILYRDIKVGDIICHPDGGTTKVLEVFNTGSKEVFEFRFNDGSSTRACDEHRWKVRHTKSKDYQTLSWQNLQNDSLFIAPGSIHERARWRFPLVSPLQLNKDQGHIIDPYLLGILIAEGSLTHSTGFSSADAEIIDNIQEIVSTTNKDYFVKHRSRYDYAITHGRRGGSTEYKQNIFTNELRRLQLFGKTSHYKFIPKEYLFSSLENRTALLQGLMDGDGSVDKRGFLEYSTTSEELAKDMVSLVQSLGGMATYKSRITTCEGSSFLSYRVHPRLNDNRLCFRLSRKKDRCHARQRGVLTRGLIEVKSLGQMDTRCIKVDAYDEMYITDDYIATKNTGKTVMAENIGVHIAKSFDIPVLDLDTEMRKSDHQNRGMAMLSYDSDHKTTINEMETGQFTKSQYQSERLLEQGRQNKNIPYYHKNVGGKPFEDQLSIMRRWIARVVGLNDQGKAKDCVIIYDYLKLMDSAEIRGDMKEFQVLGFMMTALHNFSLRYDVPILTFVQLNRDGITKESTDTASGSDRIIWLCSNFTIYKNKSDEEVAKDGPENGNRKLVPVVARHGEGLEDGDYINILMKGQYAKLIEGKTAYELDAGVPATDTGPDDDEDVAF
jgi:replicative DNA helicase